MGELVLYDHPQSSNALKVRFGLAELGLPYERRTVSMVRPRPDWYLRLNPAGGIPTLEDGDHVVSESHTILRYLAIRAGREDLYPSGLRERSAVDEFLDRFQTSLGRALWSHESVALGYRFEQGFDAVARDSEAAARVEGEIAGALRVLDGIVSPDGAVLGRVTIADCALGANLFRSTITGLDLAPYPRLAALRERLLTRPSWAGADPVL